MAAHFQVIFFYCLVLSEEGKDPLKLQQWVDFLVTFTEPIEGLYVQAYGGPMGVPTGEFTTDFKCTDGEVDDKDYELNQNIVPCHFSPRTAFMVRKHDCFFQ